MSADLCSIRLRFLILVINTSNMINERSTPTLCVDHSILAPVAFFTTYTMIGNYLIGGYKGKHASKFLQAYALVVCCFLHGLLSMSVFQELKQMRPTSALKLNGILPMFTILLLAADLVVVLFSNRRMPSPPDSRDNPIV